MPSTQQDLMTFIARQLNDSADSPHGVAQDTYYTYGETHVTQALEQATQYLYALKPDLFAGKACYTTTGCSCVVDLKAQCANVLDIIGVGSLCDNTKEQAGDVNNLSSLLASECAVGEPTYTYKFNTEGIAQFSSPLPEGTNVFYLCSSPTNMTDAIRGEYQPLLTAFALWWLLLTDNESRSNLDRVDRYYRMITDFITLKLKIETDLRPENFIGTP